MFTNTDSKCSPPKKKGKGSKGARGTGGVIDGISISEMSREQLEPFVLRIQNELEREREERNFFQLESDKIRTFWEITREQLEEYKAQIRNKENEIEEVEERHQQEMKLYQQKVKHLLYEQHSELTETKVENMVTLKMAEDDYRNQEIELLKDKRDLRNQIRELQEIQLDRLRTVYSENAEKLKDIRDEYEDKIRTLETKYQSDLEKLREELDLKNDIEISEVEERKESHIQRLITDHQKAFINIKEYYNKITDDNLNQISELKGELECTKKSKDEVEKEIRIIKRQNQKLTVPLKISQQRIIQLNHKIALNERDRHCFQVTRKQENVADTKYKNLKYSYDALLLANEVICKENESLRSKMMESLVDFQKKANLKSIIMEQKVSELNSVVEKKECEIKEMRSIIDANKKFTPVGNEDIQKILQEKNQEIIRLNKEVSAVMKSHNDVIRAYKSKLKMDQISHSTNDKMI